MFVLLLLYIVKFKNSRSQVFFRKDMCYTSFWYNRVLIRLTCSCLFFLLVFTEISVKSFMSSFFLLFLNFFFYFCLMFVGNDNKQREESRTKDRVISHLESELRMQTGRAQQFRDILEQSLLTSSRNSISVSYPIPIQLFDCFFFSFFQSSYFAIGEGTPCLMALAYRISRLFSE